MSAAVAFADNRPNRLRAGEQAAFVAVVEADMRGQAAPDESEMLRAPENVARWLRVLRRMLRDAEIHSRKEKLALKALAAGRIASGVDPGRLATDPAYSTAKLRTEERARSRLHFITHVETRIEEAVNALGAVGLTPVTLGSVVDSLIEIEDALGRGEANAAGRMLSGLIDRYADLEEGE